MLPSVVGRKKTNFCGGRVLPNGEATLIKQKGFGVRKGYMGDGVPSEEGKGKGRKKGQKFMFLLIVVKSNPRPSLCDKRRKRKKSGFGGGRGVRKGVPPQST